MALVSGPGRAGVSPTGSELHTSKHVTYIKNLDTVRLSKNIMNED
jgi:geranylgeranyl transferase type-2 subunit beta